MSKPPCVLLATLGRTDVQVVLPVEDPTTKQSTPYRFSLVAPSTRAFHQACHEGDSPLPWQLLPMEEATLQIPEKRDILLEYDAASRELYSPLGQKNIFVKHSFSEHGRVTLCAPILTATVLQLREWRNAGTIGDLLQVVLFNTRRQPTPEQKYETEPIYAFQFVQERLAQALGIDKSLVSECIFLEQGDLYEEDQLGERHLAYEAARRMDEKIREVRELLRQRNPKRVPMAVIADVGGIPETKAVLAASARYRFGNVRFLRATERPPRGVCPPTVQRLISPAESLETRRHVRTLVQMGAFEAAARLANDFVTDQQRQTEPWRIALAAVAAALRGDISQAQQHCSSPEVTPLQTPQRLGEILQCPQSRLLLTAFRVEAALRSQSWAEALRGMFTFLDLAQLQAIDHFLSQQKMHCVNFDSHPLNKAALNVSVRNLPDSPQNSVPLSPKVVKKYLSFLSDPTKQTLDTLEQIFKPIRRYRNLATHNWLKQRHWNRVRNTLCKQGFWTQKNLQFLHPQPIKDIFRLFRNDLDPEALYQNLVDAILEDMDRYSLRA
ncbi:MAG: hypothetical protein NZ602_15030 [Thermoguttaceae bacterium]|nr:hypothetical protein [Thermoguttaceae bacterium]MDW8037101.1 hypothetical protein [Thermoguttaceae bacterium]